MIYDKEWYDSLNKPTFQPPAWVFAPVWTGLYIMMFVAFVLILFSHFRPTSLLAYFFFITQLFFNFQWTPAFFKEHNLRKAFLISALLVILVFLTMLVFFHISRIAGLLLLPYFLWCIFACVLSFEILELNEW